MQAAFYNLSELLEKRESAGKRYLEFLRIPSMSAGVYVLATGASDPQRPHKQDELYYVVEGRARMQAGSADSEVTAGSVIFVAAEVEHRFYDIREALVVLVFFAPAESD
jgi:mannose-6-phosphate isomerase-like protein (cupin superfamily)